MNRENANQFSLFLLCAALVFAPFAYGCTTDLTRYVLDGILVASFLPWLAGYWFGFEPFQKPREKMPLALVLLLAALNSAGLSFLLNAKYRYDPVLGSATPLDNAIPWLPGTVDFATSLPVVIHIFCLSLALIALTSLCARSRHRRALLRTMGSTGFALAIVGIIQKASAADTMLWSPEVYESETFFGAYRYHGNAASFLMLCWPVSFAFMLRSVKFPETGNLVRAWWINAALITYGAMFVNTSKFGHIIAAAGMVAALFVFRRQLPDLGPQKKLAVATVAAVVVIALLAIAFFSMDLVAEKWMEAANQGVSLKKRWAACQVGWVMAGEAGPWGFGPGALRIMLPYFTVQSGREISGIWTHLHQDYLQVLIEWGWVAGGLCFLLFGIGIRKAWRKCRTTKGKSLAFAVSFLGLVLIAFHALVDFPLQIASIQLYSTVLLAIAWAPHGKRSAEGLLPSPPSGGRGRHQPGPVSVSSPPPHSPSARGAGWRWRPPPTR